MSAWYGLGWVDLFQGDVAGADTALARAEALGPDCKAEIDKLRRIAYTPIANSGVSALQDGDTTGALKFLQQAHQLRPGCGVPAVLHRRHLRRPGQERQRAGVLRQGGEAARPPTRTT